jgi:hypothetical protein
LLKGYFYHWEQVALVSPGGNFGHDTPVQAVYFLAGDAIRAHLSIREDGCCGIIAGGFYG